MARAFVEQSGLPVVDALAVGTHALRELPSPVEWHEAGHPLPDERSVTAGTRALEIARGAAADHELVVLLSGGASALLAVPASGISLADKRETTRVLLSAGADIAALNTVRKHLSSIKGGWLGAASAASVLTLAVSDVIGDEVSLIGSGPAVPDPSTFADALFALDAWSGRGAFPAAVVSRLERGSRGEVADTPKPRDPRLGRSRARVIGSRREALAEAGSTADRLGYRVTILDQPVTGEARVASRAHLAAVATLIAGTSRPACVISGGETTVQVAGGGRGGRNQEFALAAAKAVGSLGRVAAVASVGTDGVDGPTDAAGAIVDTTTLARARAAGLGAPGRYLDNNDAYAFFAPLGDLVRTGPTDTNVGDLQVILIGES